jgi:hypothetical protein
MKLSENTLAVLKNCSAIEKSSDHKSMVLKAGNRQLHINSGKDILIDAILDEEIPVEYGIYDIDHFLSNIRLLGGKDADLSFEDKKVVITGTNGFKVDYYGCDVSLLSQIKKSVENFQPDVSFIFRNTSYQDLIRISSINSFNRVSFIGDDEGLRMESFNETSNNVATLKLDNTKFEPSFSANFKLDSLTLIPVDYNVEINFQGISRFTSLDGKIKYYIMLQKQKERR